MVTEAQMLKTILKSSGWSQEQLANRLGVSFATINSWINEKTTPRETASKRIQDLFLAKDIKYKGEPVFITVIDSFKKLKVGDIIFLKKDKNNSYDDESIKVSLPDNDGEFLVANSVKTVARGTWSAGRAYDKIHGTARAKVDFIIKRIYNTIR